MAVCRTCGERHRLAECPVCGEPAVPVTPVTWGKVVVGTLVYAGIWILFLFGGLFF